MLQLVSDREHIVPAGWWPGDHKAGHIIRLTDQTPLLQEDKTTCKCPVPSQPRVQTIVDKGQVLMKSR